MKRQLIRKYPDAGKDSRQKGMTEDEVVGWHHRTNGYEFEQAPGDGEGQESLVCCSSQGHKESITTYCLNNSNVYKKFNIQPHCCNCSINCGVYYYLINAYLNSSVS